VLKNNSDPDGSTVGDNLVSSTGINIGDYAGDNGWAELTYKAKVKDGQDCGGKLKNGVIVNTADGSKEAEVELSLDKDCTPASLPEAGPGEIALAVIAVLCVGVGGTYWFRSRMALKKVAHEVTGGQGGDTPETE
jgi:hypothetical protein